MSDNTHCDRNIVQIGKGNNMLTMTILEDGDG